jgi:hypothetical protein
MSVLEAGLEYFQFSQACPLKRPEQNRLSGKGEMQKEVIEVDVPRPLSNSGLAAFLGVTHRYLNYAARDARFAEYHDIFEFLFEQIRKQQFDQAAIGVFKENLVARNIGLTEKTESVVVTKMEITYEDINNEE